MPNFQIPQFIEEKPKIIGPLTLSQFFYLAGAGLIIFLLLPILTFFLWFIVSAIIAAIAVSFAFLKINGQETPKMAISVLRYMWRPRTFTWQKAMEKSDIDLSRLEKIMSLRKNASLQERIKSTALGIATGKIFSTKERSKKEKVEKFQIVTKLTGERGLAKKVDYKE